jgi:pyruvate dehydrogenase E2 component (dihydrolipoamide acetyltransferase)
LEGHAAELSDVQAEAGERLPSEQAPSPEEALPAPAVPGPSDLAIAAVEAVEETGGAPQPAGEPESAAAELPAALPAIQEVPVRSFVSPRARRLARELSVAQDGVPGSGPGGRVEERDVRQWAEHRPADAGASASAGPSANASAGPVDSASGGPGVDAVADASAGAMPAVRRVVAARMSHSALMAAPVTLVTEADATELVALRQRLNSEVGRAGAVEISYDALLVRLTALALAEHPNLNARITETGVEVAARINVGVAVDTPRGLLVPVVRDVGGMDLWRVASALDDLTRRARAGASGPDELEGGTFSITNLGAYGVDAFTPIINWPECASLGVGRIVAKPAVYQGQVVARQVVALSLAFDHRAVDGATAARFLQRLVQLVQAPEIVLKG